MDDRKMLGLAAILAGDLTNEEYVRGLCELLEICFPRPGLDAQQGSEWYLGNLKEAQNG